VRVLKPKLATFAFSNIPGKSSPVPEDGSMRSIRPKTSKAAVFVLAAVLVGLIGYYVTQFMWDFTHRYRHPNTGKYHGSMTAWINSFGSLEEPFDKGGGPDFNLRLRGETSPRWYWMCPTNFAYSSIDFDWSTLTTNGNATVALPSLAYSSSSSTGVLTKAVLADLLLPPKQPRSAEGMRRIDLVFGYIEAAGQGSLPPPQHHPISLRERFDPMQVVITHFCVGFGIPGAVYIWFVVWICLVVFAGRRYLKRE
jgi:hypothetical protein